MTPADRLLVETVSPFLAPQSKRGEDNHPANVMLTLAEIAQVRGGDVEKLVALTAQNARRAFPGLG